MSASLRHPSSLSRRGAPYWPGTLASFHPLVSLRTDVEQKGAGCCWILSSPQHTKLAKLLCCWAGQPLCLSPIQHFNDHFRTIRLPLRNYGARAAVCLSSPCPPPFLTCSQLFPLSMAAFPMREERAVIPTYIVFGVFCLITTLRVSCCIVYKGLHI